MHINGSLIIKKAMLLKTTPNKNGANPKLQNSIGETALDAAVSRGESDKVELIKEYLND